MSDDNNHRINYTTADIDRYHAGEMSPSEMHDLELHAMDDPLLADAVEGYSQDQSSSPITNVSNDLEELRERLKQRIEQSERKNVIPIFQKSWFKIAALVVFIAGAGSLILYPGNTRKNDRATVAKNNAPTSQDTAIANAAVVDSSSIALNQEKDVARADRRYKPEVLKDKLSKSAAAPAVPIVPEPSTAPSLSRYKNARPSVDSTNSDVLVSKPKQNMKLETKVDSSTVVMGYGTAKKENVFSGKVVNENSKPMPNLVVAAETRYTSMNAKTDSNGYFKFQSKDSVASAIINKEGFETARVRLDANSEAKEIMLKDIDSARSSLSEVVVTGYGSKKQKKIALSAEPLPVIGMKAYKLYLAKNRKNPDSLTTHGEVTLSFIVNENGAITDYKIEKSLSRQTDNEAVRLVKEGPAWQGVKNKKLVATITIKF